MNATWKAPPYFNTEGKADRIVCWTRMQAESGQKLDSIIRRKEVERDANGGLFVWGVGNAPNRTASTLARLKVSIPVIFSVMKSAPKLTDSNPASILIWRKYIDMFGEAKILPKASLVLSRDNNRANRAHYALICRAAKPLGIADHGCFDHRVYRNLGPNGAKVGHSQVTALLERIGLEQPDSGYRADMIASLTESYWVKLTDPIQVSGRRQREILDELTTTDLKRDEWTALVSRLRNTEESPYGSTSEWRLPFAEA